MSPFQQVSTLRLSQRGCRGCLCSHFCENTSHIRKLSLTGTYSAPLPRQPGLSHWEIFRIYSTFPQEHRPMPEPEPERP